MLIEDIIPEAMAWAKRGNKVVRKFRCSGGQTTRSYCSKSTQCFAAPDIKKRMKLKMTKARLGARMVRKTKKTKRVNPASRRVAALERKSQSVCTMKHYKKIGKQCNQLIEIDIKNVKVLKVRL